MVIKSSNPAFIAVGGAPAVTDRSREGGQAKSYKLIAASMRACDWRTQDPDDALAQKGTQ